MKKEDLELLADELWRNRHYVFGEVKHKANLLRMYERLRLEGYDTGRFDNYVELRKDNISHERATHICRIYKDRKI